MIFIIIAFMLGVINILSVLFKALKSKSYHLTVIRIKMKAFDSK